MIQESVENYLENILLLKAKKANIRAVDLSNEMGYSKPTISIVLKKLRDMDHIVINEDGYIALTESGRKIAESTYERHQVLSKILMTVGVSEKTALEDACKVEHIISQETFLKLKEYFKINIG